MNQNLRDQFEEWLGREDCPVHFDESANKNAWYGYVEGYTSALASYAPSVDTRWVECLGCRRTGHLEDVVKILDPPSEAAAQPIPAYLSSDENTTVVSSARVGDSPKGDRQAEIEHNDH